MQMSAQEALVRAEVEKELEKKQIKQQLMYHSMDLANKANETKQKEKMATSGSVSNQPASSSQEGVVPPPWQQLVSPEGYSYYYNSSTGGQSACIYWLCLIILWSCSDCSHAVTRWELPSDPNPPTSSLRNSSTTATSPVITTTSAATPTHQHSIIGLKRSSEDRGDDNQTNLEPPSAKLVSPYGGWTTVAVRCVAQSVYSKLLQTEYEHLLLCIYFFRPQEIASEEEEDEEDQEGSSHDTSDNEEKGNKFKEKTAPLLSTGSPEPQVTPGTFKGFSFKKRTSTNKPQIRQRISDFSWHVKQNTLLWADGNG